MLKRKTVIVLSVCLSVAAYAQDRSQSRSMVMSVEKQSYVEIDIKEITKSLADDPSIRLRLAGGDPKDLGVIKADEEFTGNRREAGKWIVDAKTRKLVQQPSLKLSSAKRELIGDGQDETTIEIQAVSANGKRLRDFKGKVKVTTTRGKLSARGGIVDLVRGNARITLTSVNETVERVTITAHALEGVCGAGTLSLEFV